MKGETVEIPMREQDQAGAQLMHEIEGWRESLHQARTRLLRTAQSSWTSPAARAFALRVEGAADSLTRCLRALDDVHDDALRLSSSLCTPVPSGAGGLGSGGLGAAVQ